MQQQLALSPSKSDRLQAITGLLTRPLSQRSYWLIAGGVIVALALFYAAFWPKLAMRATSDQATAVLRAQDVLHGNLLLHDWYLSTDNMLFTDVYPTAAAILLVGKSPLVMELAPTLIFVALLLSLVWVAQSETNREASPITLLVLLTAVAVVPLRHNAPLLLSGPDHVGTLTMMLLAMGLLQPMTAQANCSNRGSLLRLLAAAIITFLAVFSDPAAWVFFIVPCALAWCISGLNHLRPFSRTFVTVVLTAAAAIATVAHGETRNLGGFINAPSVFGAEFIHLSRVPQSFAYQTASLVGLFGFNIFGEHLGIWPLLMMGRGLLAIAAVAFVLRQLTLLVRGTSGDWICDVSALGAVCMFAAGWLSLPGFIAHSQKMPDRFVLPSFVLASLVLARSLPIYVIRHGLNRRWLWALAGAVILSVLPLLGRWIVWNPQPKLQQFVAQQLERQGLTRGMADYWNASIITVVTRGKVTVVPIQAAGSQLAPYHWLSKKDWFTRKAPPCHFLIYDPQSTEPTANVVAEHCFGPPDHVYRYARLRVMVWNKPIRPAPP